MLVVGRQLYLFYQENEGDEMTQWINCNTCFPSVDGVYLVKMKWSDELIAMGECKFKNGNFEEELQKCCGEVTHWAELPEPPKDEK